MSLENYYEEERKKSQLSEEERKAEIANKLEYSKEKQKLLKKIEKDKNLIALKSVVERWLIKTEIISHIVDGKNLELSEVNELLSKINDISTTEKIDSILPIELRVTNEEYLKALEDDELRKILIDKLNKSLDHMYLLSNPFSGSILDIFSGLFFALNKNLVKVQEYTIDIKQSLESK